MLLFAVADPGFDFYAKDFNSYATIREYFSKLFVTIPDARLTYSGYIQDNKYNQIP